MICPACKYRESSRAGLKNGFELERCVKCKTIFANLNFDKGNKSNTVRDLYEHYYDLAEFNLSKTAEISLQNLVKSFEKFRDTSNFMDIGYGEGGMLSIAERNNWKCFGSELSPQSLKYGDQRGWTVTSDILGDERFQKERFDVVTMIELIEHVSDPDLFFDTARQLLRANGLLFLTTPNINSINRRWLGIDWSVVGPPEHITIWSILGLQKALSRNGFTILNIHTHGFNPIEIVAKYRSFSKESGEPLSRNEAAFALNDTFMQSPWRQALKKTINQGLSLLKLGDGIKIWAIRKP